MSRKFTKAAVQKANAFLGAAEAFRDSLEALNKVDAVERDELFGCTMLRLARLFEEKNNERPSKQRPAP